MIDMKEIQIDDESLERIIELADEGLELTDDELDWLMQDKARLHVYRDMLGIQRAIRMADDTNAATDTEEAWRRYSAEHFGKDIDNEEIDDNKKTIGDTSFSLNIQFFLKIAAVILLLVGTGFIFFQQKENEANGYLAFEHRDEKKEVLIDCGGEEMTLDQFKQDRVKLVETEDGEYVLDYQAIQSQGIVVDSEVESHTVSIPRGKDFRIVLADGTQVWLYADSRITYPSHFVGAERKVVLHGQAYFKVAKDAKHPFVIHTDNFDARVLGTELNVRSYEHDEAHVALINGKVEVRSSSKVLLKPGQGVTLKKNGQMEVMEENMDVYTYWQDGYIYFDDSSLSDIAQALGHWYNISVIFENKQLIEKHLHFLCRRSEPLSQAIELLNDFGGFHVEFKDNTLIFR